MKYRILTAAAAMALLFSAALPASAFFFNEETKTAPVAYDLLKNAPVGQSLTFAETDFLTDGSELDAIVLSTLPDSQTGTLTLGGQLLRVGDVISMEAVDGLVYTARDAVKLFPKNINVAATVSLLGVGFDKTKVTIVVDPSFHSNSHELRVKGEFGQMTCHTYNVPSPDNPKTSYLAAMSAISALKRIVRNEWIGI